MKIEKGIPCPYSAKADGLKYPFKEMKVGDSFLLSQEMNPMSVRNCYFQFLYREKLGWKFTVKKTIEGYRCWRLK